MEEDTPHKHWSKGSQTANEYTKRCSMWSAIKEMQTKTAVRCFTPTGMATVKMTDSKCWVGYRELGTS